MDDEVSLRPKRLWVFRRELAEGELRRRARRLIAEGIAVECVISEVVEGPSDNVFVDPARGITAFLHIYTAAAWSPGDSRGRCREAGADEYEVLERLVFATGTSRSGWNRIGSQRRRATLAVGDFRRSWAGRHARLVRRHHPGVSRYAQDFVLSSSPGAVPVDGFYESEFATAEDYRDRLYDSPAGERVIEADNRGFVEQAATERAFTTTTRIGPEWDAQRWELWLHGEAGA